MLSRYAGRGVIRYVELANEVDAPNPWWRGSTPEMYVEEMKMVHEVPRRILPEAQTVAFASAYGRRDDNRGGEYGGRRFIRKCLDLGIADYTDTWSIHYSWALSERDFTAFFRREEDARSIDAKPILNTEESAYGHPSDVIKLFARNFYIHNMPRVDYYLARDWYEFTNLIYSGLFDLDWNPKPRLLAYAAAVDGMKGRVVVGMLDTEGDQEVYLLENFGGESSELNANQPRYAIVAWVNSPNIREVLGPGVRGLDPDAVGILTGLNPEDTVLEWNLDTHPVPANGEVKIGQFPVVILSEHKPDWTLISPADWLSRQEIRETDVEALIPIQ